MRSRAAATMPPAVPGAASVAGAVQATATGTAGVPGAAGWWRLDHRWGRKERGLIAVVDLPLSHSRPWKTKITHKMVRRMSFMRVLFQEGFGSRPVKQAQGAIGTGSAAAGAPGMATPQAGERVR